MKIKDSFLDISYRLRLIKRFSIRAVNSQTTPAEHSWFVAILALYIASRVNAIRAKIYDLDILLQKALLHDVPEALTSDIVHFIKHFDKGMEKKVHQIEKTIVDGPLTSGMENIVKFDISNNILLAKNDSVEGRLVNICDLLDVMAYLSNERSSGNVQRWVDEAFSGCDLLLSRVIKNENSDTYDIVSGIMDKYKKTFGKITLPEKSDLIGGSYDKKANKYGIKRKTRLQQTVRGSKKTRRSSAGNIKNNRKGK